MTKATVFDFDTLDTAIACAKPFEFELVHPESDKPLGVFVSVFGPESDVFKNRIRKEENRKRKREFEIARKGKAAEPTTMEEDEAYAVGLLATLVAGYRTVIDGKSEPVIFWKGERLEFSAENVERWLGNFSWVRKQIDGAAGKLENFIKA